MEDLIRKVAGEDDVVSERSYRFRGSRYLRLGDILDPSPNVNATDSMIHSD